MANVFVTARSFGRNSEATRMLEADGHALSFNPKDRPLEASELMELVRDQDAVIAGVDHFSRQVIEAATKLKIIARCGVGYDKVDLAAAKERGVIVTTTPGANTISVAELTLGLMMAVARRIPQYDAKVKDGEWGRLPGGELYKKTLGIVGLGAIGLEVAKRARAFDMRIVAYDTNVRPELAEQYDITYASLPEVLAATDYLSLHSPVLPSTKGMICRDTLSLMKPSAYLINTARGELVVEEDLYEALQAGKIAGAALDVFAQEPLRGSLLKLSNVVLTPHVGAATAEAAGRVGDKAASEVIRVFHNEPPLHRVV